MYWKSIYYIRMTFYWTLWKLFAFQTLLGVQSAWKRVHANDTVIALLWFSSWLMFVTLDFSSAHKMWNAFVFSSMWVMFFDDPDKLSAYLRSAVEPWFRTVLKVGKKRGGGSSLTLWLREENLAFLAICSFCVKVLSQLFFTFLEKDAVKLSSIHCGSAHLTTAVMDLYISPWLQWLPGHVIARDLYISM